MLVHGCEANGDADVEQVTSLIRTCKALVTHVKRSKVQSQLETSVKQSVPTRWNSNLTMLHSVAINMENLKQEAAKLGDKKLQRQILDLNEPLLEAVIGILKPFDEATRILSADKTPSLHMVLPVKHQLLKGLKAVDCDCEPIRKLKLQLSSAIEDYFPIHYLHHIACLLDPRVKSNLFLMSPIDRLNAIQQLKQLVAARILSSDNASTTASAAVTAVSANRDNPNGETDVTDVAEIVQPPAKKMVKAFNKFDSTAACNFFADLYSLAYNRSDTDEVDDYLGNTEVDSDLLQVWKRKCTTWPRLSQVAKCYLALPATSTSSERSFSLAGRTLEDRRSQLDTDVVDDLLFLHGLH